MIISHMIEIARFLALTLVSPDGAVKYRPVILLFDTLLYNAGELRTYRPALSKMNGVAGNPGTKIPIIPRNSETVPANISIGLSISSYLLALSLNFPNIWSLKSSIVKLGIFLCLR